MKYLNGYKIEGRRTASRSSPQRGINASPPQDQYFKGALFINTLRSIVDDDERWWTLLHDFYQHFKYQNIMTEDIVAVLQQADRQEPDADLRPVPAPRRAAGSGTEVRRGQGQGRLSLEGR